MSVLGAIMVPHPPLIIPEVGRGQERQIAETVNAYRKAAGVVGEMGPDTVVVFSPHTVMYADYFHVSPGRSARGDFGTFGAPQVVVEAEYDTELVKEIARLSDEMAFPMGTEGEKDRTLDHGTMIPLYFIRQQIWDYRVVRIGGSGLSFADHYRAGQIVAQAAGNLGRRIFLVGSGDLSHKLKADGPYGFSPQGPEYDGRIMAAMGEGQFGELLEFSESFCEQAAECGHRCFTMMAGALDGQKVESYRLSYEGPFGVGYGICMYQGCGEDPARSFLKLYEKKVRDACMKRQKGEDAYLSLARRSLEYYVLHGKMIPVDMVLDDLAVGMGGSEPGSDQDVEIQPFHERKAAQSDVLNQEYEALRTTKAGVFVSIHKNGALRGCIGTISPVCETVAEEIVRNAVSAGAYDPRFPAVREPELPYLSYSVDVLGEAEPVEDTGELDARRYGVIVTKGRKRGLLLPDLDGVDTVEEQLRIARQKAGIREEDADVAVERFEVIRHGEKS